MKLSQEQIQFFTQCCESEQVLRIRGFNDVGQGFDTNARVARTDDAKPAVYEKGMFLDFGKPKEGAPYSDFVAPFIVEFESDCLEGTELIIEEICLEENGRVLYQNPDAEKYLQIAKQRHSEHLKKQKIEGRDLTALDPISTDIAYYIGKPIIINGENNGVLAGYGGANNFGEMMINVRNCTLCGGLSIPKLSTLETCNLEGEKEHVKTNGVSEIERDWLDKVYEARQKRIADARQNQKGEE